MNGNELSVKLVPAISPPDPNRVEIVLDVLGEKFKLSLPPNKAKIFAYQILSECYRIKPWKDPEEEKTIDCFAS